MMVHPNPKENVMATGAKRSGAILCFSAVETKGGSTSTPATAKAAAAGDPGSLAMTI
jgi:hypothetical protein